MEEKAKFIDKIKESDADDEFVKKW